MSFNKLFLQAKIDLNDPGVFCPPRFKVTCQNVFITWLKTVLNPGKIITLNASILPRTHADLPEFLPFSSTENI